LIDRKLSEKPERRGCSLVILLEVGLSVCLFFFLLGSSLMIKGQVMAFQRMVME
jgi:hypothetical protein